MNKEENKVYVYFYLLNKKLTSVYIPPRKEIRFF